MTDFDFFTFVSILAVSLPITALVSIVFETQGGNNDPL